MEQLQNADISALYAEFVFARTAKYEQSRLRRESSKIACNDYLAKKKSNRIDFDAYKMDEKALYKSIIATINGETKCKSEDIRDIAFYKTGVMF